MNTKFVNRAELEVCACGEKHVIYSNEVENQKIVIKVEKYSNKECVFEGECIDYTIKIHNENHFKIYNPVFIDDLPNCLEYVKDSFKVNHRHETPCRLPYSNKISYKLHELEPKSTTTITFKAEVK